MSREKCPRCGSNIGEVSIVKYNNYRSFGTNHFCYSPKCGFEFDDREKKVGDAD